VSPTLFCVGCGFRPDFEARVELLPSGAQRLASSTSREKHQLDRVSWIAARMFIQSLQQPINLYGIQELVALVFRVQFYSNCWVALYPSPANREVETAAQGRQNTICGGGRPLWCEPMDEFAIRKGNVRYVFGADMWDDPHLEITPRISLTGLCQSRQEVSLIPLE
jgi:hypothetical protein